ncbi:MAG: YCF48-related protein [Sideroxyarcus sp.]|nr:YCF48-related protein [Sideroxyarcus sp.]
MRSRYSSVQFWTDWSLVLRIAVFACLTITGCGGGGPSAPTPDATNLTITVQPTDKTVSVGALAELSVSVSCLDIFQVQWQSRHQSGGYADIHGATSQTLSITSPTLADNGAAFRAKITSGNQTIYSRDATLTVGDVPSISIQPQDTTVVESQMAVFVVGTAGSSNLYQWQKKAAGAADSAFADIAGATSNWLYYPAAIADDGSVFRVVIRNTFGNVISSTATLSVTNVVALPAIVNPPTSVQGAVGGSAFFEVIASGVGPLTYQWQERRPTDPGFIDLAGATSASYTVSNLTLYENGTQFRVLVTNSAGTSTSAVAYLTVDAGLLNWTIAHPDPQNVSYIGGGFFTDSQHGIVNAENTAFATSDGGATWVARDSGIPGFGKNVYFIDANNGWAVSSGGSYYYQTGPASWTLVLLWGAVSKTTDGGVTWQRMDPHTDQVSGPFRDFEDVYFTDLNTGWIVGAAGQIYKTIDSGVSWTKQDSTTSARLTRVQFVDAQHGFVLGKDASTFQLFILQTGDGGTTWSRTNLATFTESDFSFTSGDMGFASTQKGWATIGNCAYGTTDGGATWSMTGCTTENIVSMAPSSDGMLYVKSDSESLFASADGGATFTKLIAGDRSRYISQQRLLITSNKTIWRVGGYLPWGPPTRYVVVP